MRISIVCTCLLVILSSTVFAAAFVPNVMKITGQSVVQYDFDGKILNIPVTFSGAAGAGVFCVFTKDIGDKVGAIQNGFLGWHYVDGIDTCLYVSPVTSFSTGSNILTWDGKDADRTKVPAGEYTYYVWAYDDKNARIIASRVMPFIGSNAAANIRQFDENGIPLTRPEIFNGGNRRKITGEIATLSTHQKWILGSDPEDSTMMETTAVLAWGDCGNIEFLPSDHTMWFKSTQRPNAVAQVGKYQWVPNGESVLQTDWGEDGFCTYPLPSYCPEYYAGLAIVENAPDLITTNSNFMDVTHVAELVYIDVESGSITTKLDVSKWWVDLNDGAAGGQSDGGPTDLGKPPHGWLSLNYHGSCLQQVIDPYRFGEPGGDIDALTIWANMNGDYVADKNFEADSPRPWVCNDYNPAPSIHSVDFDRNGFYAFSTKGFGAISFGLMAPDGTGIGNFVFADDANVMKFGIEMVDYDSAYDGMYSDNRGSKENPTNWWYIPHDDFQGIITSNPVVVDDDAPAAFTVAQNSPNPFNPTTTINFTTAEAGNVTIDIYNVAGQKVDTIANEFMNAGSHSVTWDAGRFSAGVYFYTVKSGDFSRTMKMTLLR